MYSNEEARILAGRILDRLDQCEAELMALSIRATSNSVEETMADLNASRQFLRQVSELTMPPFRKPKGDVLIMLSYNEPLLVSVVPVFCALVTGNTLRVRPSSKNLDLFAMIWSELISEMKLDLHIVRTEIEAIESEIQQVRAVYFFGSHSNARKLYALCAKHFVEFIPEIETADIKVLSRSAENFDNAAAREDIEVTLGSSYGHGGKMCQRLSGIYVNKDIFDNYISNFDSYLTACKFDIIDVPTDASPGILQDIAGSRPERVYGKDGQYVVLNPDAASPFALNGYFNQSLWIRRFEDERQLIEELNARTYFMGINVKSDKQDFIEKLITGTRFSRYTLNDRHCDISKDNGWGGNWPSGSGGYRSWFETFSTPYTVIT